MLKFYRKIRRRLLEEGNLKRYLLYAIGEILLVMVGILLALQVNNWNENRKERKEELSALSDLKDEFNNNKERFLESINYKKDCEKNWKEFLISIKDESTPIAERAKLERGASGAVTTNLTNSSLNAILASRRIDKIENDSLKMLLISWNDIFEDYQEEEARQLSFFIDKIQTYEQKNIPIGEIAGDERIQFYKQLTSNEEVEKARMIAYQDRYYQNLLITNHWILVQQINEAQSVDITLNRIIRLLDQEINLKTK